jgi:zinc transport system substrate-binding protein
MLTGLGLATAAAGAPRVATDIAPVHSLVSQVMAGVKSPTLVIQRGASPHNYSLRPSEAGALEGADVVFWVGPSLTPWLTGALDNLAGDARSVALLDTEGTQRRDFRERVLAGADHGDHDDHGHEGHEGHEGHQDHDGHDDHGDHGDHDGGHQDHGDHGDHGGHAGHDHAGTDPHAWLDPANARHWLGVIAETLAAEDPAHADQYRANAEAARAELADLSAEMRATLAPVSDVPFIVFHDAYQYFEHRFDLNTVGAISLSDASDPGPAHLDRIRSVVREHDVQCVFAEPQFNPQLVETVLDGTDARTGVLDPLGSDIPAGEAFYARLLEALGERLKGCLAAG